MPAKKKPKWKGRRQRVTYFFDMGTGSEIGVLSNVYVQWIRLWQEVRFPATVDVCPTGHDDVHAALDALLAGRVPPRGVGRKERELAECAIFLFKHNGIDLSRRIWIDDLTRRKD
jgi:hypothetical protein